MNDTSSADKIKQFKISQRDKNHASTSLMLTRPVPRYSGYSEYNFFCPRCGDGCFTEGALRHHTINSHEINPILCPVDSCSVTFKTEEDLESHMKYHLKLYLARELFRRRHSLYFKKGPGKNIKCSKKLPKEFRKFLQCE